MKSILNSKQFYHCKAPWKERITNLVISRWWHARVMKINQKFKINKISSIHFLFFEPFNWGFIYFYSPNQNQTIYYCACLSLIAGYLHLFCLFLQGNISVLFFYPRLSRLVLFLIRSLKSKHFFLLHCNKEDDILNDVYIAKKWFQMIKLKRAPRLNIY